MAIEIPGTHGDDDEGGEGQNDVLSEEMKEKKRIAIKYITDAAKLISGVVEDDDIIAGYQWIIDCLQQS
jgi:intraflagellar transport protein 88